MRVHESGGHDSRRRPARLAHANGLFLSSRRACGSAARMRAHRRSTSGVTLASALNEPNVTKPAPARPAAWAPVRNRRPRPQRVLSFSLPKLRQGRQQASLRHACRPVLRPRCRPAGRAGPPRAHRARARAAERRAARRARACNTGSSPAGARAPPRTSARRRARPRPRPSAGSPPPPGPSSWGTRSRSPARGVRVGLVGKPPSRRPVLAEGPAEHRGIGRSALAGRWARGPAGAGASSLEAAGRAARLARGALAACGARARRAPARARAAWRARPGGCRRCAPSAPPARRSGPRARAPPAPPPPGRPPGRPVKRSRAPGARAHPRHRLPTARCARPAYLLLQAMVVCTRASVLITQSHLRDPSRSSRLCAAGPASPPHRAATPQPRRRTSCQAPPAAATAARRRAVLASARGTQLYTMWRTLRAPRHVVGAQAGRRPCRAAQPADSCSHPWASVTILVNGGSGLPNADQPSACTRLRHPRPQRPAAAAPHVAQPAQRGPARRAARAWPSCAARAAPPQSRTPSA